MLHCSPAVGTESRMLEVKSHLHSSGALFVSGAMLDDQQISNQRLNQANNTAL